MPRDRDVLAEGDICVKAQVLAGGRGKGTFTNGYKVVMLLKLCC
jgi:succinyl-CoA synthetase beta subunit